MPTKRTQLISADQFSLACYGIRLQLTSPLTLPVYKGDRFHRAFGRALEQISPRFGSDFFDPKPPADWPDPGQTPPKPFLLLPPMTAQTDFREGDILELGITLFGQATQHLMTVFAALEKLGAADGIDKGTGRFQIQRVTQINPSGVLELYSGDQSPDISRPTTAADIFLAAPAAAASIELHLLTPLRLKERDRIVRRSPSLAVILERLLGRINTLAAMYCGGLMLPPEEKCALITLARTASIETDNTQWRDWHRPAKSGGTVNFGGITGDIRYANVPAVLLPWLSLGQWTGVGGKTSFGLGRYSMEKET